MHQTEIDQHLFVENRQRLTRLMAPGSLAVVNANDIPTTNADGTLPMPINTDLFYLTGIEQEQSIVLLYPDADEEKHRAMLFLRESSSELEIWEGPKLTKERAREISGIEEVRWLPEFPRVFHTLMSECEHVYLNSNEHKRAVIELETREARFVADVMRRYPLHDYRRLAPLLHSLRAVKSAEEIRLMREACRITEDGLRRVLRFVRPGVSEREIEAEYSHEFIRQGGRFAYQPIIASGVNSCFLHYVSNSAICREGDIILLDVGASYSNYNADMTRTIPVSGRFTRRQKQVYQAVRRVMRESARGLAPGKKPKEWQHEAEQLIEKALVDLGLLTTKQIRQQPPDKPAFKKYFMHGIGHPLGLDVHDVAITTGPMQAGWVMTVEPGIYIREEGFGIRLENNVLVTDDGPIDLMAAAPLEADEIEDCMQGRPLLANGQVRASRAKRQRTPPHRPQPSH